MKIKLFPEKTISYLSYRAMKKIVHIKKPVLKSGLLIGLAQRLRLKLFNVASHIDMNFSGVKPVCLTVSSSNQPAVEGL